MLIMTCYAAAHAAGEQSPAQVAKVLRNHGSRLAGWGPGVQYLCFSKPGIVTVV